MRTSTRARNALVGVVSATALTGGALAVTAAPASAATGHGMLRLWLHRQVPPGRGLQQRRFHGLRAVGLRRHAQDTRHAAVAVQLWLPVGVGNGHRYQPPRRRHLLRIYDRGTHALEVATTERATFTRQWQTTKMVGVAKTKAQACIEVRNPRTG